MFVRYEGCVNNNRTNSSDVRPELMEVVESAIVRILSINFAMLGVEPQHVPTTGSTASLRSRGYLFGLAEAVILQFSDLNPTQEEFISAFASAFAMTYGPCDWNWALDTIDSFQAKNPDAVAGARLGHQDAQSAYDGNTSATPTGFWLLNSGDEEAVRAALAQL
jgi:hypothetical protein